MTHWIVLAAVLPGLLWSGDPGAASQAGIDRIYVPAAKVEAWRAAGVRVQPDSELETYVEVPPPQAARPSNQASATSAPWIDANGWRFQRGVEKAVYRGLPRGAAPLAAAEAFAYGADAVLEVAAQDLPGFARMLAFLRRIDAPPLPVLANIGILDDGSESVGEVLNLLGRRNLLYKVVRAPDPALSVNVRIGSAEFPLEAAQDPDAFARRLRKIVGDERRLVRLFGSYTVLAHLTGDGKRSRLHLINYARVPVTDLRVRVLGAYRSIRAAADEGTDGVTDSAVSEGGTEFTIPRLKTYAVVDLIKTGD